MSRWQWGIATMLAATLVAPLAAQENRGATSAAGDPELAALLDDVTVLRAVSALRLTPAQLAPLVQKLQSSAGRVEQANRADAAAWSTAARTLRQAVPQAVRGAPTSAADAELARVQQLTRGKLNTAREESRAEVRALLEQILTPAQKAMLLKMGRDEMVRRRLARLESADFNQIERMGRDLDRLREASPRDYSQERRRFAMRMANLPGWWEIGRENRTGNRSDARGAQGGNRSTQGGDRGVRGGNRGQQGGNRGDGLESEQRRLRQEQQQQEARQQLADPARQAQMRQFQMLADQVRGFPAQTYAQRRTQLATQLYQSESQTRAQTASPEEAMDAFIDRYLLALRAPVVLAERLQAMG